MLRFRGLLQLVKLSVPQKTPVTWAPCVNALQPYHHLPVENSSTLQFSFNNRSYFSTSPTNKGPEENPQGTDPVTSSEQLSIYQRFKRAYKEHGKVLVGVHLLTSSVWMGTFYYMVISGIDIVPLLESWEVFSEDKIAHLKSSNAKDIVQAYLMYKLATPARYTVTLLGTNFAIKYFQKTGRMQKPSEREKFKDLMKDGRQEFKDKRKEIDSKIKSRTSSLRSANEARRLRRKSHHKNGS